MAAKWMLLLFALFALPAWSAELICTVTGAEQATQSVAGVKYDDPLTTGAGSIIRFDLGAVPKTAYFDADENEWIWDRLRFFSSDAGSGYAGQSQFGGMLSAVFSQNRERVVVTYTFQDIDTGRDEVNQVTEFAECKTL